ncbi:MAG: hypothetical protein IK010_02180 [Bacteroidales bacterium]|nr:hypothetical protein [Bacteroidales bacterium]
MSIFHRYKSTIHGNYRRAYLRSGLVTGLLLAAGHMALHTHHSSLITDHSTLILNIVLMVAVFLFTAWYRHSLPDQRITLKESMLFGMGLSLVAALLYALLLLILYLLLPSTDLRLPTSDYPAHYWAALWAIVAAVGTLLLGSFSAFLAAIFLRNEKSEIKKSNNRTIKQ